MAEQQEEPSFGPVRGLLVGTLALCLTNALAIAVQRLPRAGVKLRVLRHLLDAGQHLALGLVLIALVALAHRLRTRGQLGRYGAAIATAVATALLAFPLLSDDLSNFAWRVAPAFPRAIGAATAVGIGLGFATLVAASDRVRSRAARAAIATAGLLALALNHVLLPGGYSGVHLFAALAGVTAIAAALCTAKLPRRWPGLPARWPAALQLAPWAATALLVAPTLLIWPGTPLVLELLRSEGSVVMPQLARLHAAQSGPRARSRSRVALGSSRARPCPTCLRPARLRRLIARWCCCCRSMVYAPICSCRSSTTRVPRSWRSCATAPCRSRTHAHRAPRRRTR